MAKFDVNKTTKLLWPNIGGVLVAIAGHYLARGIDHSQEWTAPWKRLQDYWAVGSAAGAWAMYCANMQTEFADSFFDANLTLIGEGLADRVFGPPEETFGPGGRIRRRIRTRVGDTPDIPASPQAVAQEAEDYLRRYRKGAI